MTKTLRPQDVYHQPAAIVAAMASAFSAHACYFRIK